MKNAKNKRAKMWSILAIALVAVIGFSMAACGGDDDDDGGGGAEALVGKWYQSQTAAASASGTPFYEFTSDGRLIAYGADIGPYTATSTTITLDYLGSGSHIDKATYTISGNVLTITTADPPFNTGTYYKAGGTPNTGGSVNIEMVSIPAGTFTMGSPTSEQNRSENETQHLVTLSAFRMGKYQVTEEQYQAVTESNPSSFSSSPQAGETKGKRPVENVTWYDAVEFCNKLSVLEGLQAVYTISGRTPATGYPITSATVTADFTKNGYRLPTEAEWEYACRAGTTTAYNTGATITTSQAWYSDNSEDKTHQVGLKPANAWGLYDMHGNVWEWCWDWYEDYSSGVQIDPRGASSGTNRVRRGGGWNNSAEALRSAYRDLDWPRFYNYYTGFRIVRRS